MNTFKIAYQKFIILAATDRTSENKTVFNPLFTVKNLEEANARLKILSKNLYQDEYGCIIIFDNDGANYFSDKIPGEISVPD